MQFTLELITVLAMNGSFMRLHKSSIKFAKVNEGYKQTSYYFCVMVIVRDLILVQKMCLMVNKCI